VPLILYPIVSMPEINPTFRKKNPAQNGFLKNNGLLGELQNLHTIRKLLRSSTQYISSLHRNTPKYTLFFFLV